MHLRVLALLIVVCLCGGRASLAQSVSFANRFPLIPTADGHHLVDRLNRPFLYIADTAWLLAYALTTPEADEYLRVRQEQGFTVIQLQILPASYSLRTQTGQSALNGMTDRGVPDLKSPNEAFFAHLDTVIQLAAKRNMAVMLAPAWFGNGSIGWRRGLAQNGAEQARVFGRFLGSRYAHNRFPNVIGWIHGGDANPETEIREVQALAEGIQTAEQNQPRLHTAHWQSPFSTRDQTPSLAWLNLNATYTAEPNRTEAGLPQYHIYAATLRDYQRLPAQPTLLLDSDHEDPGPDAVVRGVSAGVLRRQAWWGILSGSAGVTYGSVNAGPRRTDWREVQQLPVARQMHVVGEVMSGLPWTQLVPDGLPDPRRADAHHLIVSGSGTFYAYPGPTDTTPVSATALMTAPSPGVDYIVSAATPDRSVVMAYVPPTGTAIRSFEVDLAQKTTRPLTARWVNPTTGSSVMINEVRAGRQTLTTPGDNGTGQNDWLLVVQAR